VYTFSSFLVLDLLRFAFQKVSDEQPLKSCMCSQDFLLGLQKLGKVRMLCDACPRPTAGMTTAVCASDVRPGVCDTKAALYLQGDWRGISRHYVVTRTPTQVASHAQKHFIRQQTLSKRKRRHSLFDITGEEEAQPVRILHFSLGFGVWHRRSRSVSCLHRDLTSLQDLGLLHRMRMAPWTHRLHPAAHSRRRSSRRSSRRRRSWARRRSSCPRLCRSLGGPACRAVSLQCFVASKHIC
jgi:hypothetical protein